MTKDDEITPARLRELADVAFDTEFRVLQAALRAAADAIEVERETNGVTALLLQQARTALAAREALLREADDGLRSCGAALVAATSLLERGGREAAPSDKMFAVMLDDYRAAIERFRALAAEIAAALGGKTDE